jgi:two-component system nitrate/nitrite response regulator NarL
MPRRSQAASSSQNAVATDGAMRPCRTVRILIISDVRLYRDALALRLAQDARFSIVGATEHGSAIADVERLEPELVLLDVCDWQHLERVHALTMLRPGLPIVALAVPEVAGNVISAALHGVAGCVPRGGSIDDVIALIERLAACRDAVARSVSIVPSPGDPSLNGDGAVVDLTPRENEIAQMIELGLSNKEIARDLGIEVGTVKNHVHNILEKLQVRRRHQAAHRIRARLASL